MNIRKRIDSLGEVNRSLERVIIDTISAVTPWLAPLVPASMVFNNMSTVLGFPIPVAFIGAASVEFLGLSAINTAVEFWRYNEDKHYRQSLLKTLRRRKSRKFNGAPFLVALFTGIFYIAVVLTVNAILDIGREPTQNTVAKALLSLLSVDAGVIIAIRASHSRRTHKVQSVSTASTKTLGSETKSIGGSAETSVESTESVEIPQETVMDITPSIPDYETYTRFCEARNGDGAIPPVELIGKYRVPKSTAYKWYGQYEKAHSTVSGG